VNLLQRMRELAVQAANDTNGSSDRTALGLEMTALTAEIDRIANVTSWAGIKLLDGPLANVNAAQTTQTGNASFEFHIGSGNSAADEMIVTIGAMGSTALGIAGSAILPQSLTDLTTATNGAVLTTSQAGGTLTFASGTAVVGDAYSVKINGTTVNMAVAADQYALDEKGVAAKMKAAIEAAGIAGINVADNGSGVLTLSVGNSLSVTTATNAQATIGTIDSAINTVNAQRAQLGSWSNRLDSTISNLTNISTNLEAGRGRIEDADFAAETTNLAKSQILQQASMAMLAQANASKQGVLSLLQR
jgi:flagellin